MPRETILLDDDTIDELARHWEDDNADDLDAISDWADEPSAEVQALSKVATASIVADLSPDFEVINPMSAIEAKVLDYIAYLTAESEESYEAWRESEDAAYAAESDEDEMEGGSVNEWRDKWQRW